MSDSNNDVLELMVGGEMQSSQKCNDEYDFLVDILENCTVNDEPVNDVRCGFFLSQEEDGGWKYDLYFEWRDYWLIDHIAYLEWADSHQYGEEFQSPQAAADDALADLKAYLINGGNRDVILNWYGNSITIVSHDDDEYSQLKLGYDAWLASCCL